MKFIVCGSGSWGTAMAVHLARIGHELLLVPRSEEKAKMMQKCRENIYYLPHIPFPDNLYVDTHCDKYLSVCDALFVACPMKGLMDLCTLLKTGCSKDLWIISLIKGLDHATLRTSSDIIAQFFPKNPVACLSGPTYAVEFALGKPAAMVLASFNSCLEPLQKAISSAHIRVYRSGDLKGVETASCLKNIYALGAGILDGLKLGDNAKSAYLTRALKEMSHLGCALGGHKETFYGLSGLGDLMATAQGTWSRNRTFGELLAKGQSVESLTKELMVESYGSLRGYHALANKMQVEVPILQNLYDILYNQCPLDAVIHNLLSRPLKNEFE
ncbi:MAG: NAD(P)-dependent glycerol-3-phosphate dehydrogenase [Puniceicoccales bacterium]|jgi:glycerol-3-phosphate dehydrogenase (NAD(P)+)|nr:NAD(P)-dependent glycerol-3-phosphate dehydrogenase [Puniceicoccales bacterium]